MIQNCPVCKSHNIELYDCGYSSFNCGGGKCRDCKFEGGSTCLSSDVTNVELTNIWNRNVDEYKVKQAVSKLLNSRDSLVDQCAKAAYTAEVISTGSRLFYPYDELQDFIKDTWKLRAKAVIEKILE